ncbi:hypothetical protein [Tropicimonas isoalkanivorans]|uniref:DUF7867 domain-containing protein n=1 Tax=Tropicimonas isoalkanivorans TaxID=441112 RepID=A0A1I1KDI9_9RHOB|nr:hypothetical protein [Tropicimonas isoalkanivorans]SFC55620.1 hypothetical protein SAMN04488094_10653 [Tropicimonas isoalkanivorans]
MVRAIASRPTFREDEAGAGTVFGLFMFVTFAVLLGLMLDGTQGWWNKTRLAAAADIGAHAGAVAMANGKTEDEIVSFAVSAVETNLPSSIFGNVIDASTDVILTHYDPVSRKFEGVGDPNAVMVRVQRSEGYKNAIPTFLLKLAGFGSLETSAVSASVFDINGACSSIDGIYSYEKLTLTSQTDVGAGFCLHSKDVVWLPQQNTFEEGSFVSMPDLDKCKNKCTDSANPGIVALELNMILPDYGEWIQDTYNAFAASTPYDVSGIAYDFFKDVTLGDQSELIAKKILKKPVAKGTVVPLTTDDFHDLSALPAGLVYLVNCNGNGKSSRLYFSDTTGQMSHAALISDCNFDFEDGARAVGSVLITMRESSSATVTAKSKVTIADPFRACDPNDRTILMSMSKVKVPANFVMSNVTLVVDDDVDIASATSKSDSSVGFSIHASGTVHVSSQHTFRVCGSGESALTPKGKIVRLVNLP